MEDEIEEKKRILAQIETLIAHGGEVPEINPKLLNYLDLDALHSIKASLLERSGKLSEEDKAWLQQFRSFR